jgi:hypothetical protein
MSAYIDIPFLPDWRYGVNLNYAFETAINISQTTLEQRAAMREYPFRKMSCTFSGKVTDQQPLVNRLISLLKTNMVVPIFSEQFKCTLITLEGTQGGGAMDFLTCENVANCYNLSVANQIDGGVRQWIVVFDKTGTYPPTKYQVSGITGNVISLWSELDYAYTASNMLIFPAFVGVLESFRKIPDTDSVSTINATFSEVESWYDKVLG